jgi:hypothetical protein
MGALTGKIFAYNTRPGVKAIAAMEVIDNIREYERIRAALERRKWDHEKTEKIMRGLTHVIRYPIFTFCDDLGDNAPWYTGDEKMYHFMLGYVQTEGARITKTSFYIPFSNQIENGAQGADAAKREMRYYTDAFQFEEAFKISQRNFIIEMKIRLGKTP